MAGSSLAAEEPRTRHLVRCGDDIQVEVIAEGSGPLVVVLPSGNRDSEDLGKFAALLGKESFRVLRPQPRGMGKSKGPMTGITLHDFGRDVAEAIKHEASGPAVVVGHAYGAWIARVVASDHPDLVRGVVLAATSARNQPEKAAEAYRIATDPERPEDQRLKALQDAFFAPGLDPKPWLEGWHPEVRDAYSAAGKATDRENWWSGGSAPMLDLQGEVDPWRPEATRNEIKDALGDRITVKVIPDASHVLRLLDEPEVVVKAITEWIATI